MKRILILITLLVISTLMISPAVAETLPQTQDQQTQTTSPVSVAATNETPSTVVASEKAVSGKKVVVGNKDTKRYHLFGMPGYDKVKNYHRIL